MQSAELLEIRLVYAITSKRDISVVSFLVCQQGVLEPCSIALTFEMRYD